MEHEINKIIREKVLAAEGEPASWQKERVWRMIRPERAPKSHRAVYYYAAAASLLIVISMIYAVYVQNQKQLAEKISGLESVINDKIKPENQDRASSGAFKTKDAARGVEKATQPIAMRREIWSKQIQPVATVVPEIIPEGEEEQAEIAAVTINDGPVESVETAAETPPVQAIIGFIPKPQKAAVTIKSKKTKFRLFRNRNEEFNTLLNEENRFLTARIN